MLAPMRAASDGSAGEGVESSDPAELTWSSGGSSWASGGREVSVIWRTPCARGAAGYNPRAILGTPLELCRVGPRQSGRSVCECPLPIDLTQALREEWCPRGESNPHSLSGNMDLNHARLPIPPPGLGVSARKVLEASAWGQPLSGSPEPRGSALCSIGAKCVGDDGHSLALVPVG